MERPASPPKRLEPSFAGSGAVGLGFAHSMLEALIPYIDIPTKVLVENPPLLGRPLELQPFGPLVATGVILG